MSTISASPATGTAPAQPSLLTEIEDLLGFRPEHSLAILVRRPRLPSAVLRVDLPPSLRRTAPATRSRGSSGAWKRQRVDESECVAHSVTGMVAQLSGARSVDLVVYVDQPTAALNRLLGDVASRLHAAGFRIVGLHRVMGEFWSPLVMRRRAGAWRIAEGERHVALGLARFGADGPEGAVPSRREGIRERGGGDVHHGAFVPVIPPSPKRLARAMATVAALERRQGAPERELVDDLLEWQSVLAPEAEPPSDARAIALAWGLRSTDVRDCVLMLCAWGFEAAIVSAIDAVRADSTGAPGDLRETVLGTGGRAPEAEQLRRSIEVLRSIAECAPDSLAAPLLTMLAWLEWCRGRGSAAAGYLDAASKADDAYLLTHLLRQMMRSGHLPEWIT